MNVKKISLGLLFFMVALVVAPGASATPTYYGVLQSIYGGPAPPTCVADCHDPVTFVFTAYGNEFRAISTHSTDPAGALLAIGPPGTITVSPSTATLTTGGTKTFTAAKVDPFGNALSYPVTWSSSNTTVGTIGSTGVFTAAAAGTATVTASNKTVNGTASVTVTAPAPVLVLTTITVSPSTATLTVGGIQAFTATGHDQNGNTIAISPAVVWISSNTTVGTISSSGVFTALAAGTATVTAKNGTSGTISGTATVTVTAPAPTPVPVLTTITVSPSTATLTVGGLQTFKATGYDQNSNPIAISPAVVWSSSNTTVGTINSSGIFTTLAAGTTTITATNGTGGTVSGTATATVIAVVPPPPAPKTANVTFKVTDNATGNPIQGAAVYLNGLHIRTDRTGIAVFSNVPLGIYNYAVSKVKYRTASGSVNVTADINVQVKLIQQNKKGSGLSSIDDFFRVDE